MLPLEPTRTRKLFATFLYCLLSASGFSQYRLVIESVDKDEDFIAKTVQSPASFRSRAACAAYIENLAFVLQTRGYPGASVDSVSFDSTTARIKLFLGDQYKLAFVGISEADGRLLERSGWNHRRSANSWLNPVELRELPWKVMGLLENEGYPFVKMRLDSISFRDNKMTARLNIDKGPLYRIDSIRIFGSVKISNRFMQRYLNIENGSLYNKAKLEQISKRLRELPYLQEEQEWNLTLLGTGSVVNLYLKQKKSSQVNVLVGLLPDNLQTLNNKLLVTGEANIQLRNELGHGEMIGLDWQQLQVRSPRLNLQFQQPYFLGSSFGVSTNFDLFKKDSSFLNLNFTLGVQFAVTPSKSGSVFIQHLQSNLLSIDTLQIKAVKKLPSEIDVNSLNLGVDYRINTTDYRFNPRRGTDLQVTVSAGSRRIRKNNTIVRLHDTSFSYASLYDTISNNTYQFRIRINAARYLPVGTQSTLKTSLQAGWIHSPSLFRNELFQIGGFKLLRGFDEESIYASGYAVASLEYRYLIALNSYIFSFIDAAAASSKSTVFNQSNRFLGAGLGMAFETKAGIFNISYAAGKRDDSPFNLRQSKIHIGYVNYF